MSEVRKKKASDHREVTIGDRTYIYRKSNVLFEFMLHGTKVFNLIEGVRSRVKKSGDTDSISKTEQLAFLEAYLGLGMVSPRLADETDDDADTRSLIDFGDDALTLFNLIRGEDEKIEDFTESSSESTEQTLP